MYDVGKMLVKSLGHHILYTCTYSIMFIEV